MNCVQAFNLVGTGPKNSPEVLVSTAEDVPSLAPSSLTCSSSSSTSLTLSWQPPPPEAMHGVLTAFTVYYRAMREWEVGKVVKESTQDKGLTLTGLQPYQNYTLQVSDLYLCKCLPKDQDKDCCTKRWWHRHLQERECEACRCIAEPGNANVLPFSE